MVDLMWRDLTFCTGPMVDLMWRDLTFCQCFFSRETRKFMAKCTFWTKSSSDMPTFPTATERHKTFFIWNLMVDFRSSTFCSKLSLWVTKEGNLPALLSPGPRSLGICLIRVSEARNASYFLASFLTFFLSLLSFFRSSADMQSMPRALAWSQCCWSPSKQTLYFWRGTCFNFTVPEKRLSFWGS